jgi:hypothetical protein
MYEGCKKRGVLSSKWVVKIDDFLDCAFMFLAYSCFVYMLMHQFT